MAPDPITPDELRALFGDTMPMEAVRILFPERFEGETEDARPVSAVRADLVACAERHRPLPIPSLTVLNDLLQKLRNTSGPIPAEDACRLHAMGQHGFVSFHDMREIEDRYEYRIPFIDGMYSDQIFVSERDLPDRDLTAAAAFAERVFPNRDYSMSCEFGMGRADVANREATADTVAKALCMAVLMAAIRREEAAIEGRQGGIE